MSEEKKREPGHQHWCTPTWILDRVRNTYGEITLDPFSNPNSATGALVQWYGPDADMHTIDGFAEKWHGYVFFNPPFSRTREAVKKAHDGWAAADYEAAIGIFPCSMNSRHWWMVEAATVHGYFRKRPCFVDKGVVVKGARHDIAIAYWGREPRAFVSAFRDVVRFPPGTAALASLREELASS